MISSQLSNYDDPSPTTETPSPVTEVQPKVVSHTHQTNGPQQVSSGNARLPVLSVPAGVKENILKVCTSNAIKLHMFKLLQTFTVAVEFKAFGHLVNILTSRIQGTLYVAVGIYLLINLWWCLPGLLYTPGGCVLIDLDVLLGHGHMHGIISNSSKIGFQSIFMQACALFSTASLIL